MLASVTVIGCLTLSLTRHAELYMFRSSSMFPGNPAPEWLPF